MTIVVKTTPSSRLRAAATCIVAGILLMVTSHASSAASDPADVVRLKNGGIVRGTILEAIPGETVRIELSDGKVREFAPDLVEYAGPNTQINGAPAQTATAPVAVPPAATETSEVTTGASVVSDKVRVRLLSDQGATFGINAGTSSWVGSGAAFTGRGLAPATMAGVAAHYRSLCTAPCEVDLQRGTHEFSLTLPDGRTAVAKRVNVPTPGQIRGNYVSRSGLRAAGWITFITGGLLGTLIALDTNENCDDSRFGTCTDTHPNLVPGLLLATGSMVAGMIMGLSPDRVDATFVPSQTP